MSEELEILTAARQALFDGSKHLGKFADGLPKESRPALDETVFALMRCSEHQGRLSARLEERARLLQEATRN